MENVLVIGYGNPARSDDGVGWVAAHTLSQKYPLLPVLVDMQLLVEMAARIVEYAQVIFIDAAEGDVPGSIHHQRITPREPSNVSLSHFLMPAHLLYVAATLYEKCPTGTLFTVVGDDFGEGEGLSALVMAAVPTLIQQIEMILNKNYGEN